MNLFYIAFSLFLLMDPIGNVPLYISFMRGISPQRQRIIVIRELLIALFVIILFQFVGAALMRFLHIGNDTVQIAGGIILFIICLKMIFPQSNGHTDEISEDQEPFIVPLAIPLVAGPSVLAAVMIYSEQEASSLIMTLAILLAWIPSLLILLSSSFITRILGKRGIMAAERLMGLILILIAVQMFLSGLSCYMTREITECLKPQ